MKLLLTFFGVPFAILLLVAVVNYIQLGDCDVDSLEFSKRYRNHMIYLFIMAGHLIVSLLLFMAYTFVHSVNYTINRL